MCQPGQDHLTATEKVWIVLEGRTFSLLLRLQCAYSFSNPTKEVFSVQEAYRSPHMLPTVVHDQTLRNRV